MTDFLDAVDVFLDEVTSALQVDERVAHYLAGAVVGDLPAPVGLHYWDVAGQEYVLGLARQSLGERPEDAHKSIARHAHPVRARGFFGW